MITTTAGTKLRDETRKLLLNRPASLEKKEIAEALGVTVAWVNKFSKGEIENPGVVTIEKLNDLLKAYKQKVG